MGGIVSKVTDAVGLTNTKGEKAAAANAAKANAQGYAMSKEQIALMKEQLQFQKDQYKDWQNIYGDVQKNLGDYYKTLGPEKITALGLENQQKEFQFASAELMKDMAQRGLSDSGIERAALATSKFQNAEARARIRTEAPEKVAQAKLGFLGVGLGQGTAMLGAVNNAAANANSAYSIGVAARSNAAGNFLQQQTQFSTNNTNAMGQIIGTGMGFI